MLSRRNFRQYYIIVFLIVTFFIGYGLGRGQSNTKIFQEKLNFFQRSKESIPDTSDEKLKNLDFSLYWKVWDTLQKEFVEEEPIDPEKLFYGSLEGMARATDDPYTNFFDPKLTKEFQDEIDGTFEGIGAEIGLKKNLLTIIAPLEESPAQNAGIRAGDVVMKINGEETFGITLEEAVDKIRGEEGTDVTLTIARKDEDEPIDITITRNTIHVKAIKLEFLEDGAIAHIKLTRFMEDTEKEFFDAIKTIEEKHPQAIILDMRNNPGGYLNAAIDVTSEFIEKGEIVVSEKGKNDTSKDHRAGTGQRLLNFPLIVLVNEGSASGSEIVAGALQDHGRAKLLGEKTFGKGSVQKPFYLPNDTLLKITVAKWFTPNGRSIDKEGLMPDIEVKFTKDDYNNDKDPQLDRALEEVHQLIN